MRMLVGKVLLATLVAVGLLAGCGDDDESSEATASIGSDTSVSTSTSTAPPDREADPARDDQAATRTIEHLSGVTEVPADPQRVYTNSLVLASHLVSVGLQPAALPSEAGDWFEPFRDTGLIDGVDLDAIDDAGSFDDPSFEQLAQLDLDLIVIEDWSADAYDLFAGIAPTVTISRPTNADWQAAFDQTVDVVNRHAEAEVVRARYQEAVAASPSAAGELDVAFLRGFQPGQFRIDALAGFAGSVGAEAGYGLDTGGRTVPDGDSWIAFSNEEVGAISADLIVTTPSDDGPSSTADLQASPLWESLEAVEAGQVVELPIPIYNGGTYIAAELLLEAMTDALSRPGA